MSARAAALAVFGSLLLMLAACGTPPEVKTLSAAQVAYFDKAIEAMRVQSEALLVAAERIKKDALEKIDAIDQDQKKTLSDSIVKELPGAPASQRESLLQERLEPTFTFLNASAQSRANLEDTMAQIKEKTVELQAYIVKMKEVQLALDAYLQSQQAGEKVVHDVLGQPGVSSLLGEVNALVPKVTETVGTLKSLIEGLPA
jgi:hypothetical protein